MAKAATRTFHPPSADHVASYLDQHTLISSPSRMGFWLTISLVLFLALLSPAWTNISLTFVIWLAIFGMFINSSLRHRRLRKLDDQLTHAQELTLQRHNAEAMHVTWHLIPQLRSRPQQYTRAIALLAHNLEQNRAYESAVVAFNRLLKHLPEDHPATFQMRVEQTMAMLSSDQLTDADNQLRKLRNLLDRYTNTPISAGFHLALLYQQIRTNHFRDASEHQQDMMSKLRPLGIQAGLGYALLALACYQSASDERDPLITQSQNWWNRATLLLPVASLLKRFPELAPIEQGPSAAAHHNKPATTGVETHEPPIITSDDHDTQQGDLS